MDVKNLIILYLYNYFYLFYFMSKFFFNIVMSIIFSLAFNQLSLAQGVSNEQTDNQPFSFTAKRANILSLDPIGNAGIMGVYFDTRFDRSHNGLGIKMGAGYIHQNVMGGSNKIKYPKLNTFHVQLNYLLGRGQNVFETGIGVGYLHEDEIYPSLTVAYRRYATKTRFVFNVGVSTFIKYTYPVIGFGFRI